MNQRKASGFTLIELMIAIAIIAVLAAISYPAYINHTVNTRRAAATACMTEMAQFMERTYTTDMSYADGDDNMPNLGCRQDLAIHYTFTPAATATTFTVQAIPQGQQASKDTKCGTLGLTHTGQRSVTGSASDPIECW